MPNLLEDASRWGDPYGSPPEPWTGAEYAVSVGPETTGYFGINYIGGPPSPADVVAGNALQTNTVDPPLPTFLNLVNVDDDVVLGSVLLPQGESMDFSFTASASMRLILSSAADSTSDIGYYGLQFTLTPTDAPDPPGDCCDDPEPREPGYEPIPDPVDPDPPEPTPPDTELPNCDCDDETSGRRTIRQLRDAIMAGLGFVDTLGRGPQKTLCQMRCSVLGALNLGGAQMPVPRTLGEIRTELTRMSGYSANIPTPPGYAEMVDAFVNQAQQALWQRLEMSRGAGATAPAWLSEGSDPTEMDGALVQMMALALLKAHYQKPDAAAYREYVESIVKGQAERQTPVTNGQIDNALRRARYTVWTRPEALPPMAEDDDMSTIHFVPIELLAIAELKARLGHKDAEVYRRDYERYVGDNERRSPADAPSLVTGLIQSAQAVLGQRYAALHTERFYSWPLTEGVRLYDIPDNSEACPRKLDPRKVTWVGVEKDGQWYPLICGIPPELYTLDQTSFPQRYEIRSCIEVWPTPDETAGRLIVKGHFAMAPFTEDYHRATIDDELIFLHALAAAKAHYKQPDARDHAQQVEVMLTSIVAGSHHTRRYLPGARVRTLEPEPVWTVGSWP